MPVRAPPKKTTSIGTLYQDISIKRGFMTPKMHHKGTQENHIGSL